MDSPVIDSVGITEPISDIQDRKSLSKLLADLQYMEFTAEDGVMSSEETLLYWYESITMQYLGLQQLEIMDPMLINEDQVSPALYGPSFGVLDNGESAVLYPETKSTVTAEREPYDPDANDLQKHTPGHGENDHEVTIDKEKCMEKAKGHTARENMKKRKTDECIGGTVVETYLKKSKSDRCKSSQSHEEKSNTKLDVISGDPPELQLLNISKSECEKDYIHLRAPRGQATNSHSLAERVRREKISQRMRVLQELVPGCNKVTSKVLVLEEIINYVQSMQKQVEILSSKLACAVPLCNSHLETDAHPLSTDWSNLKHVEEIHGIMMPPQTIEKV